MSDKGEDVEQTILNVGFAMPPEDYYDASDGRFSLLALDLPAFRNKPTLVVDLDIVAEIEFRYRGTLVLRVASEALLGHLPGWAASKVSPSEWGK